VVELSPWLAGAYLDGLAFWLSNGAAFSPFSKILSFFAKGGDCSECFLKRNEILVFHA